MKIFSFGRFSGCLERGNYMPVLTPCRMLSVAGAVKTLRRFT